MFISRIKIKNFRSLLDVEVSLKPYTALVGLNDSGKSNLLRALNLFFNNQTEVGKGLNFKQDFSKNAKVRAKQAKEIYIELEFATPPSFKDKTAVIWWKTYRGNTDAIRYVEGIKRKGHPNLTLRSKNASWVRSLTFEYVPAIRDQNYFLSLKRRLYTTLAETVTKQIEDASGNFLNQLRKEVKSIENETVRLLKVSTEFRLPRDLGELFEILDLEAADASVSTSLMYRGDGIQGQHVPIILKFLADQRKVLSAKGRPKSETIWGFEEPENNLELLKQVDTAKEFEENSQSIQIILSTHSPAFYQVGKKNNGIILATRSDGATTFTNDFSSNEVDKMVGLMPFIEPYLEKAIQDRDELKEQIESMNSESLLPDKNVLIVEGDTDRIILEAAFRTLEKNINFEILTKKKCNGGANWVANASLARAQWPEVKGKTAALLDDDEGGKTAKTKINSFKDKFNPAHDIKVFVIGKENANDEIREIKIHGVVIGISIEELCGEEAWKHADNKDWLIERKSLNKFNGDLCNPQETLASVIEQKLPNKHCQTLIFNQVDPLKKGDFAKFVADHFNSTNIPETLKKLIDEIVDYFGEKESK